jgi:hypothetical protein
MLPGTILEYGHKKEWIAYLQDNGVAIKSQYLTASHGVPHSTTIMSEGYLP